MASTEVDDSLRTAVPLGAVPAARWADLVETVRAVGRDPVAALRLAPDVASRVPLPGRGRTLERWAALAGLGAVDLAVARALEPHLDAVAILDEAGAADLVTPGSSWGVFAAEGPGVRLEAGGPDDRGGAWSLQGTKPWCSLADDLTHALVTAWVDETSRGLFAVGLRAPSVSGVAEPWVPHGLREVRSAAIRLDGTPAVPVGGAGWYLRRDGFAWGGIGVAAVWYGGAVALLRRMQRQARERTLDQVGHLLLGRVDAALTAAGAVLAASAEAIDAGRAAGGSGAVLAQRVRVVVHDAAETALRAADHALGPGPLAHEAEHADRVADLRAYLRQHHAERDEAALGRFVADEEPW